MQLSGCRLAISMSWFDDAAAASSCMCCRYCKITTERRSRAIDSKYISSRIEDLITLNICSDIYNNSTHPASTSSSFLSPA
jgi:hypothetical protein